MTSEKITLTDIELKRKIYAMIIPITLESILQMSSGIVAMAMIGRIDTTSVAAVGLSNRITQLIWALFRGITTGATVFVAQAYGANDMAKVRKIVQQVLVSSIILVVALQQLVFWKAPTLLSIFGNNGALMDNSAMYLRTISFGIPFLAITQIVAGVLQGTGNAKTPMKIALVMNIINISLNYLLIYGGFGLPTLGLRGSAMATATAQFTAAMVGLYILFSKTGVLGKPGKGFYKLNMKEVIDIYKVGAPTSVEAMFWQVSAIFLTKIILSFGETAMAAYQLGFQVESISFMPAAGFGVAATAFIGQALGGQNPNLARRYLREIVKRSMMLTAISTAILLIFPSQAMGLLTDQPEVIAIGATYLLFMGIVQVPQNLSGVLNGAMRGAGYTQVPMIVATAGLWGIRIPFSFILTSYMGWGITAVWGIMAVDLACRCLLSFTLYKKYNIYEAKAIYKQVEA
ncbi:MATE family efflux transporter [Alkaliphilus transvaalensis]|uniref:MATE family efflux transporter n=1 Tax=Alkaliphilus transvaalensis TaxID=114628 RepID=UPI00047E9C74|nr:MATE family efflux transporter [Alkaliphilus transvaalensis]